ncbi:MAG TPA: hypothetical protein VFC02_10050 [Anaerolineales bacterium]|nr:hypothetical protein [Anaerolineales bacterium]
MQILTRHLIEIIKEKRKSLPQPVIASGPGEGQDQIQIVEHE